MRELKTFEYAIIRYVPIVEREEFINIGVVVFSKHNKFLDVRFHLLEEKLKVIDKDCDLELLTKYLNSWKLICQGDPRGGVIAKQEMPYRFRWLTAARSTIIQSSRPHPGLCEDPKLILDQLFAKYVS